MKKVLYVLALAAAVMAVSCKGDKDQKKDTTGGVDVAKENLVAYLPLNSATDVITLGKGMKSNGVYGKGEFNQNGFRGGCYNNSSASHDDQAGLKITIPDTFLPSLKSYSISAWYNTPTERGAIYSFAGGKDPNWGAFDLFQDGADENGTLLKGYMCNMDSEWFGFFPDYRGPEIAKNKWIHTVMTYDEAESRLRLYVNKEIRWDGICYADQKPENGEQPLIGDLVLDKSTVMYIGAFASRETGASDETWLSYLAGKVDEIRIWNKALSEEEVSALYTAELTVSTFDD